MLKFRASCFDAIRARLRRGTVVERDRWTLPAAKGRAPPTQQFPKHVKSSKDQYIGKTLGMVGK